MIARSRLYKYVLAVFTACLFCLHLATPSYANNIDEAHVFINSLADKAFIAIAKTNLSETEKQTEFRALLRKGLDINFIAKFVLGPYRRKATEQQIDQFTDAFEDFIILTYTYRFDEFKVKDLIIAGVTQEKRGNLTVSTDLILPSDSPSIHIDWRIHKLDDEWKIIDITIEGLSMMTIQREEYVAVIRQGGGKIDYLINALINKNKQLAQRNLN